ncbi:hypothetical protein BBO99_00005477 [Phytophthora kernoviae]|uniref:Rab-GAP TBC domain-containing protein n=1 Tax=Phytophthora kernoviae TaxID=325452 RepID=A0A3R7G671_9STRA|nr:hypothetical protein JM18_003571 [Phytophthora kernoviae]RLN37982.1 hypothetical protein BBI17_002301 [Phytophthora kernoviae]RLN79166.1 hypothetical protein BBO99_00005477 [Phytophthora kernoviae]
MQGMNGLAFILLEVLEDDKVEAFRFLRGIVARILPHVFGICCDGTGRDHFDLFKSLVEVGDVLQEVARLHLPNFHAALDRAGLPVCLLAYKWFPTLFSDVSLTASHSQLRYDTLLCCWDVCLLLGLEGMFCVALALCSAAEDAVLALGSEFASSSTEQVSASVGHSLALLSPEDLITSVCEVLELCSHPAYVTRSNSGSDARQPRVRVLSTATLFALSFFAIGSGPESGEAVITAAGPLIGLSALVIFPIVYFLPMAFVVTELVSAIPEAGGHAYWVALAFGPAWGLQAGFWAWVGNCMQCAMYASVAVASIYRVVGFSGMPFLEYTMRAALAMLLAMPGFFHLRVVGSIAASMIAFVLIPFVIVGGNLERTLVWCFNGFQNLSVFAKYVHDPSRTFRRVMLISLWLTPLTYLVPILPVTALEHPSWRDWTGAGSAIYSVCKYLGGSFYTAWITVVALLSASGLYIGGLLCSVYMACGMAEKGFAPFSLRFVGMAQPNTYGIDHSVIFCSLAIILIVVNIELKEMILISNALEGLTTIVLIAAAVQLRITRPDLPRATHLCGDSHPLIMASALVLPFSVSVFVVIWGFTRLIPAALTSVFLFSGAIYGLQTDLKDFKRVYGPGHSNSNI